MAKWIRILAPDWLCEARTFPRCDAAATWEEDRTADQISKRLLPALRCDDHLPSDAEKIAEDEPEPMEAAK